jgi:hypothetical protein
MSETAQRQGRLAAALLLTFLVLCGMISAFNVQRTLELEIVTRMDRDTLRQIAQRLGVENAASAVTQTRDWDHMLIRETTPALAEASLQKHAFAIVERAGGQTSESGRGQPLDPAGSDGLVNLVIAFDGPVETVQRVLFDLERSAPAVLINRLDIEPSIAAMQTPQMQKLQVTMQLTAQWREP